MYFPIHLAPSQPDLVWPLLCGLLPLTNDIAPHGTLRAVLPLLAAGHFSITPYGTLRAVLPLLGGGDTIGRRQHGLEVVARLRGGGEASWEAAVLVTGRDRGWEAS